jgi:hypothetical protein
MNSVKKKSKLEVWRHVCRVKPVAIALIIPWTVIQLTACSSDKGSTSSSSGSPVAIPLSTSSYAQVCNGAGLSEAVAYSKSPGVHPLILMNRDSDQSSFNEKTPSDGFPKSWQISYKNAKDGQLVTCITTAKRELKKKCDFPASKPDQIKHVLEMYNTTYDVTLYEAKTGKKIASKSIVAKADECPMFHMFKKTEEVDKEDGNYEQALINFVKPHVQI